MLIIGLTGRAGTGKDTFAEILGIQAMQQHNFGVGTMAFAGPLKAGVQAMFGLTDEQVNGREKELAVATLYGKTPREIMQKLGTEFGREMVGPDVWIRVAQDGLDNFRKVGVDLAIITDVRFDNEAEFIRDNGGIVVKMEREAAAVPHHKSEEGVDQKYIYASIHNHRTIDHLHLSAAWLLAIQEGGPDNAA